MFLGVLTSKSSTAFKLIYLTQDYANAGKALTKGTSHRVNLWREIPRIVWVTYMKDLSPDTKGVIPTKKKQASKIKAETFVALGISALIGGGAAYLFGSSGDIFRDAPIWALVIASSITMYRSISKRAKSNPVAQ